MFFGENKKNSFLLLIVLTTISFFLVPVKTNISYDKMKYRKAIYVHTDRNVSKSIFNILQNK